MNKFDRVFNGDDVVVMCFVNIIDHRRQCGGFYPNRLVGNQHKPWVFCNGLEYWRCAQIISVSKLYWEWYGNRCHTAALIKCIHTETSQIRDLKREVDFQIFFKRPYADGRS